jgi:hypothetical protein
VLREAHRALKPSGILAFTFHHSEDEPWVAVLESLFDAGYYLKRPIPSVPMKPRATASSAPRPSSTTSSTSAASAPEPKPVSWGRMRREVMADVRQLQAMLENHAKEGLPAADIQVIRRGKALEYFSRHYGKVYVDEGRTISVKDALVGINQLIDEDADKGKEPPPVNAEPITRQFLRTFGSAIDLKRDQLQKFLKGRSPRRTSSCSAAGARRRTRFSPVPIRWTSRANGQASTAALTSDLDQALVLIGACFDGSGINASDTLKNENFKPHVALKPLLEWLHRNGPDQTTRNAASRAVSIYNAWQPARRPSPFRVRCSMTMRSMRDEATARYGMAAARHQLGVGRGSAQPDLRGGEVWSLRQFLRAVGNWPDDLPSNGKTLVVAGLDGSLDLLTPADAEAWLGDAIKPAILSFQDEYEGEAALAFWLPVAKTASAQAATDEVSWLCKRPTAIRSTSADPVGTGQRISAGDPAARRRQAGGPVPPADNVRSAA